MNYAIDLYEYDLLFETIKNYDMTLLQFSLLPVGSLVVISEETNKSLRGADIKYLQGTSFPL